MNSMIKYTFYVCILIMGIGNYAFAFDASDFEGVKGYTVIDVTYASGTFEGANFNNQIELDNGMVFKFLEYKYHYAYRPYVVVFGRYYDLDEIKHLSPKATTGLMLYKLLIDEDFYNVFRVR